MYLKIEFKEHEIISGLVNSSNLTLEEMHKEVGCRVIDIVNLNDEVAIICDDEGLLISANPVYKISDAQGNQRQIAGTFLIAKDVMTEDGPDARGFSNKHDLFKLIDKSIIDIIGFTR